MLPEHAPTLALSIGECLNYMFFFVKQNVIASRIFMQIFKWFWLVEILL